MASGGGGGGGTAPSQGAALSGATLTGVLSSTGVPGSERVCWCLGGIRTNLPALLQTIYNAITNGTPCVIVEGSGRVADVIAQVANLPVAKITIALIQKKLSVLFHDTYELFTESKLVEWTRR